MAAQRAFRVAAAVCATALVTSGCAYLRQVSSPQTAVAGAADHPALSADGRYTAYTGLSDTTAPGLVSGIYRYDAQTNSRARVTFAYPGWVPPDNPFDITYPDDLSFEPAISADGRYVAFASDATNLVPNDTNDSTDVFVRDMVANSTTRVSVLTNGTEADDASYRPSISADGRKVMFISNSDVLSTVDSNGWPDAYVRDLQTSTTTLASRGSVPLDFGITEAVLSGNGNFVAFTTDTDLGTGDENFSDDVYVRNLAAGTTTRISKPKSGLADEGGGDQPSLSHDGRYVAFIGWSDIDGVADPFPGLDVFVRDTVANTTARVSLGPTGGYLDGAASDPTLSSDGRRVIYTSTGNATGTDSNARSPTSTSATSTSTGTTWSARMRSAPKAPSPPPHPGSPATGVTPRPSTRPDSRPQMETASRTSTSAPSTSRRPRRSARPLLHVDRP